MHNLRHNKVLHERVVFLTVAIGSVPRIPAAERVEVLPMGQGFFQMTVHFGFMDRPDVAASLELAAAKGLVFDPMQTTFFLSRATVVPSAGGERGMAEWRESMFATMARNARTAADYYNIPTNCVIELGTKIAI
jgi:KUP system potassium uptake protein